MATTWLVHQTCIYRVAALSTCTCSYFRTETTIQLPIFWLHTSWPLATWLGANSPHPQVNRQSSLIVTLPLPRFIGAHALPEGERTQNEWDMGRNVFSGSIFEWGEANGWGKNKENIKDRRETVVEQWRVKDQEYCTCEIPLYWYQKEIKLEHNHKKIRIGYLSQFVLKKKRVSLLSLNKFASIVQLCNGNQWRLNFQPCE